MKKKTSKQASAHLPSWEIGRTSHKTTNCRKHIGKKRERDGISVRQRELSTNEEHTKRQSYFFFEGILGAVRRKRKRRRERNVVCTRRGPSLREMTQFFLFLNPFALASVPHFSRRILLSFIHSTWCGCLACLADFLRYHLRVACVRTDQESPSCAHGTLPWDCKSAQAKKGSKLEVIKHSEKGAASTDGTQPLHNLRNGEKRLTCAREPTARHRKKEREAKGGGVCVCVEMSASLL